jgi:hypothetical protein
MLDGQPIGDVTVDWRGPLHVLSWREEGRMVRWMAFPDVLDSGARRELRLWSRRRREHAGAAAVAP